MFFSLCFCRFVVCSEGSKGSLASRKVKCFWDLMVDDVSKYGWQPTTQQSDTHLGLRWFASERTFSELANTVGVDMVKGCSSSPWWENMASWASINPVKSEYGTFLCSINFLPDLVALKLLWSRAYVTNHGGKNGSVRERIQDGRTKKDWGRSSIFYFNFPQSARVVEGLVSHMCQITEAEAWSDEELIGLHIVFQRPAMQQNSTFFASLKREKPIPGP